MGCQPSRVLGCASPKLAKNRTLGVVFSARPNVGGELVEIITPTMRNRRAHPRPTYATRVAGKTGFSLHSGRAVVSN